MKKIIYSLLGLGCMALTACDMNLEPEGTIVDTEALQSAQDCYQFRNSFYNNLRALSTGGYISYTEMQMDNFIGTQLNGNRLGELNNGSFTSSTGDIESIWGGLYGGIADVNFFLGNVQTLLDDPNNNLQGDIIEVNRYVAEAHFTRAYFYFWLMDHFCPAYTEQNKDQRVGMPIVTVYNPTGDKSVYPERSTLAETYKFIEDELKLAYDGLEEWQGLADPQADAVDSYSNTMKPMSSYLNTWIVKALQARIALLKRDWNTAITLAQDVINNGPYTLTRRMAYADMWTKDTSNELIFRPLSTATELGISSTGSAWISTQRTLADYIPVPYVATEGSQYLYDRVAADKDQDIKAQRDVRYTTFVTTRTLIVDGVNVKAPVFNKYPGNSALVQSSPNLMNMAKPFRLSELYLIVAEAACEANQPVLANKYITDLRNERIQNYVAQDYSGDRLRQEVRKERLRELIGEGFRMSDLRRWQVEWNRADVNYPGYPGAGSITTPSGRAVVYQATDYRYIWPLPATEIQVNPKLNGQQNPGY